VYRTLRRHGVDRTDAEDLTQDVFMVAWRRWPDFDVRLPLRPWLAGIAFNLVHQHRRRRRPEVTPASLEVADEAPLAEQHLESNETRGQVLRALARLPERHRAVLVLHDLDDLSVDEIAALQGVPRFTVYTRLRRARLAFAAEIERLHGREATTGATLRSSALLLAQEHEPPPLPATLGRRLRGRLANERLPQPRLAPAAPLSAKLLVGAAALTALLGGLGLLITKVTQTSPQRARTITTALPEPPRSRPPRLVLAPPEPAVSAQAHVRATARPAPSAQELARGLAGHWRFDDGPGSSAAIDDSGHGYHCVLSGLDHTSAWVAGVRAGALDFAFKGWLECPQPSLPRRPTAALTVAAWVKRRGNPISHHVIAMRGMGTERQNYFLFGFVEDMLMVSSSGWEGSLTAAIAQAPGRWMHVAFTHDSDRTTRLFIDGSEVARRTSRPRRMAAADGPLIVGAGLLGADRRRKSQLFDGTLDELRVYERALGDDELRALAQGSHGPAGDPGAEQ
jgi:RNA polymerase sigma-70 factor (ECF subfamily)